MSVLNDEPHANDPGCGHHLGRVLNQVDDVLQIIVTYFEYRGDPNAGCSNTVYLTFTSPAFKWQGHSKFSQVV